MIKQGLLRAARPLALPAAIAAALVVAMSTEIAAAQDEPPPSARGATDAEEPGGCVPTCRKGFYCRVGKCVSLCNPACGAKERCNAEGECIPVRAKDAPARYRYFALQGGFRAGLNTDHNGFVRVEIGGKYISWQLGPGFGSKRTNLRSSILGRVPFRPVESVPFYLEPVIGLGFIYSWPDDGPNQQDIFLSPGLRLRYDPTSRLAVFVNVLQVDITFVRLTKDANGDITRQDKIPTHWHFGAGVGVLY